MIAPSDVLGLALELSRREDEAALRASVSRAYYAAFLHLRETLRGGGDRIPPGGASHREVRRALAARDAILAARFESLRVRRNAADYDLDLTLVRDDASHAYLTALRLMSFSV